MSWCGGAKANVVQSVGFVRWVAPLLILPKRWLVVLSFVCLFNVCTVVHRVTANGSGLCVRAGNLSTNAGFISKSSFEKLPLNFALQPA